MEESLYFVSWAEMPVRVRKGGFMVKHLALRILIPMFYSKLYNYIYCLSRRQWEATGGPLEATGGNRCQFPRTDLGLAAQI